MGTQSKGPRISMRMVFLEKWGGHQNVKNDVLAIIMWNSRVMRYHVTSLRDFLFYSIRMESFHTDTFYSSVAI